MTAEQIQQIRARLAALGTERAELEAILRNLERQQVSSRPNDRHPALDANKPSVTTSSSSAGKVALFRRLFVGCTDIFPARWDNRKTAAHRHLSGVGELSNAGGHRGRTSSRRKRGSGQGPDAEGRPKLKYIGKPRFFNFSGIVWAPLKKGGLVPRRELTPLSKILILNSISCVEIFVARFMARRPSHSDGSSVAAANPLPLRIIPNRRQRFNVAEANAAFGNASRGGTIACRGLLTLMALKLRGSPGGLQR